MVEVNANRYGTLFISVDGVDVADSTTFRRQRGFWNRQTKQFVAAPDLTPRKVFREPARVLAYLDMTGTKLPPDTTVQWVGPTR